MGFVFQRGSRPNPQRGPKAILYFHPSPRKGWRPKNTLIWAPVKVKGPNAPSSGTNPHIPWRAEIKMKLICKGKPTSPRGGRGPSTSSLRTSPCMLLGAGTAMDLMCLGPGPAYFNSGPVGILCHVQWVESSIAWPRHVHIFSNDQSTNWALFWDRYELYVRRTKAQVYVHQAQICPSCKVQESRGRWQATTKARAPAKSEGQWRASCYTRAKRLSMPCWVTSQQQISKPYKNEKSRKRSRVRAERLSMLSVTDQRQDGTACNVQEYRRASYATAKAWVRASPKARTCLFQDRNYYSSLNNW